MKTNHGREANAGRLATRSELSNRIQAVMEHIPWYTIKDQARLAADVGVARSTIGRLIKGECSPSYTLVCRLTEAMERRLGRPLDPRELISSRDGTYPTASVCKLVGCRGCIPRRFYDSRDAVREEYRHLKPGEWSVYPASKPVGRERQ